MYYNTMVKCIVILAGFFAVFNFASCGDASLDESIESESVLKSLTNDDKTSFSNTVSGQEAKALPFKASDYIRLNEQQDAAVLPTNAGKSDVSFKSVTAVYAPALVSPENNETIYCDASFSWSANGNGSGVFYTIYVYDVNDLANPIIEIQTTETSYSVQTNNYMDTGSYNWKVEAQNGDGEIEVSAVRQFMVENDPPNPSLYAFSGWQTSTPTFKWNTYAVEDDVYYTFYIDGEIVEDNIQPVSGTTITYTLSADQALSHGLHNWYVVAHGCKDSSAVSGVPAEFKVDALPPPEFDLVLPEDGTWFDTNHIDFEHTGSMEDMANGTGTRGCSLIVDGKDWGEYDPTSTIYPSLQTKTWDWGWMSYGTPTGWTYAGLWDFDSGGELDFSDCMNQYPTSSYVTSPVIGITENTMISFDIKTSEVGGYFKYGNKSTSFPYKTYDNWRNWSFDVSGSAGADIRFQWYAYYMTSVSGCSSAQVKNITIENGHVLYFGDGEHEWYMVCRDQFDNQTESTTRRTIYIDTTSPVAAVPVSPANNEIITETRPTLTWEAATDTTSGIKGYQVYLNGVKISGDELLSSDTISFQVPEALSDGSYTWYIVAEDNIGHTTESDTLRFYVDTTAPSTPSTMTPEGVYTGMQFCWSDAYDQYAGTCRYDLYVDDVIEYSNITVDDSRRDNSGCVDFYNSHSDGPHSWYLEITDCVGNSMTTEKVYFSAETLLPDVFTAIEPENNATVQTLQPLFCWNESSDIGSGIDHYDLYIDDTLDTEVAGDSGVDGVVCIRSSGELTEGNHSWSVYAVDGVGHTRKATGMMWIFNISPDVTAPVTTVTAPSTNDVASCSGYEFTGTVSDLNDDDTEGSGIEKVEIKIDSSSSTWSTATLSGPESNLTWSYSNWSGESGQHVVYVRATDNEGNVQEPVTSIAFVADCEAPGEFDLSSPVDNAFAVSCETFVWDAASDEDSGIANYQLVITDLATTAETLIDAGAVTSYTLSGDECLAVGSYNWKVVVYDRAGYSSESNSTRTILVDTASPEAFALTGQTPVNPEGWVTSCRSVTVNWEAATDVGPAGMHTTETYQVYLDGNATGSKQSATSYAFSNLTDGEHSWSIRAYDAVGNYVDSSASDDFGTFKIDCSGPDVSIANSYVFYPQYVPNNSAVHEYGPFDTGIEMATGETAKVFSKGQICYISGNSCNADIAGDEFCTNPEGTAEPSASFTRFYDDKNFAALVVSIDGHADEAVVSGLQSEYNATNDGNLMLATNDYNGNDCQTSYYEVTIQQNSGFNLLFPANNSVISELPLILNWSDASDSGSGLAHYEIILDGSVVATNVDTSVTTYEITVGNQLSDGGHTWKVKAYDNLNNIAESSEWTFYVDTTSPDQFAITSPIEDQVVLGSDVEICWEAGTDSVSGISRYHLYLDGTYYDSQRTDQNCLTIASVLSEGEHCVYTLAEDKAGNITDNTNTVCFFADNTASDSFNLLIPEDDTILYTAYPEFCWEWASDDYSAIAYYELWLNDEKIATVDQPANHKTVNSLCYEAEAAIADGSYDWYVTAVNEVGLEKSTVTWSFDIVQDTTPPEIIITSPQANSMWGSSEIQFSGTVRELPEGMSTGIRRIEFFVENKPEAAKAVDYDEENGTWSTVWTADQSGDITLCLKGIDNEGNENDCENGQCSCVTITVDLDPPSAFTILSPENEKWVKSQPTFKWESATDAVSQLKNYILILNGTVEIDVGTLTSYTLSPSQSLDDGICSWTVAAVDNLGNVRKATDTFTINVDNHNPNIVSLKSPADGKWTNNRKQPVCWNAATDNGLAGIDRYMININDSIDYVDGNQTCYTVSYDFQETTYSWSVTAIDKAGNVSADSATLRFNVDFTVPPAPAIISPTEYTILDHNKPTFKWSVVNDLPFTGASGISSYFVFVDSQYKEVTGANATVWDNPLEDGEHSWKVVAYDNAGNISADSDTVTFIVDTCLPGKPKILSPQDESWSADRKPVITWGSSDADICSFVLTIDEYQVNIVGNLNVYAVPNGLTEGNHSLSIYSVDCAGNKSDTDTISFNIDVSSPHKPVLISPEDGHCTNQPNPTLSWSDIADDVSGIASVAIVIDEEILINVQDVNQTSMALTENISEGTHQWNVIVHDFAGNSENSDSLNFTIDQTIPVAKILNISDNTTQDSITISGETADEYSCGIQHVVLQINDGEEIMLSSDAENNLENWSYDVENLPVGKNSIVVRAVDTAGNTSETYTVEFILDECSMLGDCDEETHSCSTPKAENVACDDNDKCTENDMCSEGQCVGALKDCGDGLDCTSDSCNPDTGECNNVADDLVCNTDNDCVVDFCSQTEGCAFEAVADWTQCESSDSKACFNGVCTELADNDSCDLLTEIGNGIDETYSLNTSMENHRMFIDSSAICQVDNIGGPDAFFKFSSVSGYTHVIKVSSDSELDLAIVVREECSIEADCINVVDDNDSLNEVAYYEGDDSDVYIQVIDVTADDVVTSRDYTLTVSVGMLEDGDNDLDEESENESEDETEDDIDGDSEVDLENDEDVEIAERKEDPDGDFDPDLDFDTEEEEEEAEVTETADTTENEDESITIPTGLNNCNSSGSASLPAVLLLALSLLAFIRYRRRNIL